MLPINSGGHSAYQDTFVSDFLKFYPDPFVLSKSTGDIPLNRTILFLQYFSYTNGNFLMFLLIKDLSIQNTWLLQETVHLSIHLLENVVIVSVIVKIMVLLIAIVRDIFLNPIVILVGTLHAIVTLMGTTFTCLLLQILLVTYLFSLCWSVLQDMICFRFYIVFLP